MQHHRIIKIELLSRLTLVVELAMRRFFFQVEPAAVKLQTKLNWLVGLKMFSQNVMKSVES
jgi:hypothetical protein